jgi:hypothetical protein
MSAKLEEDFAKGRPNAVAEALAAYGNIDHCVVEAHTKMQREAEAEAATQARASA